MTHAVRRCAIRNGGSGDWITLHRLEGHNCSVVSVINVISVIKRGRTRRVDRLERMGRREMLAGFLW